MRSFRTTLVALLLAAPVLAAPGGPGDRFGRTERGFGPGPGGHFEERAERIAELLDLDAAQRAAFEQMRSEGLATAKPRLEQLRAMHEQMQALLDSGSTDAATIGAKAIAIHQLRGELRAERQAAEAEFVKLLSDEQRFAFEALKEARDELRPGMGMRHGGFGPRRGPAPELD
jgi:Spy/CpxP family protein refolding chaperone